MPFIELHLLQNFAPSNLNRDESNTPKSTQFGGYRRARISSQCLKRQIRQHPDFKQCVSDGAGDMADRSKRFASRLADRFVEAGKDSDEAWDVVTKLFLAIKVTHDKQKGKSEYLLYIGRRELEQLYQACEKYWGKLVDVELPKDKKGKTSTNKKVLQKAIPAEVKKEVKQILSNKVKNKTYAVDIALFGRMVSDYTEMNVDAACQVAHALSTNEVKMEMDFFTALDDLKPDDQQGSDMMGGIYFNSSCYYRYAQINLDKLMENLGNDKDLDLVLASVKGFIKASVAATPTGKQNSTAAQNPVSYIRGCVRNSGSPWSLVNAFISPIRPKRDGSSNLETDSALALEEFMGKLKGMYGNDGFHYEGVSTYLRHEKLENKYITVKKLVNELVDNVSKVIGE